MTSSTQVIAGIAPNGEVIMLTQSAEPNSIHECVLERQSIPMMVANKQGLIVARARRESVYAGRRFCRLCGRVMELV